MGLHLGTAATGPNDADKASTGREWGENRSRTMTGTEPDGAGAPFGEEGGPGSVQRIGQAPPGEETLPIDTSGEAFIALRSLLDQVADNDSPATARIAATIAAQQYLEALTRTLVDEALEQEGATWDDLAESFGTTPANVKSRFGSYRRYD